MKIDVSESLKDTTLLGCLTKQQCKLLIEAGFVNLFYIYEFFLLIPYSTDVSSTCSYILFVSIIYPPYSISRLLSSLMIYFIASQSSDPKIMLQYAMDLSTLYLDEAQMIFTFLKQFEDVKEKLLATIIPR